MFCYVGRQVFIPSEQYTYSTRLIVPFLEILTRGVAPVRVDVAAVGLQKLDDRVRVSFAHDMLRDALASTEDAALGLKAARTLTFGDCGALDYMMRSAADVRGACEIATRYLRLINDAVDCELELKADRALWRLKSRLPLPAVAEDFQLAAFYRIHLSQWVDDMADVECWFMHEMPDSLDEYTITFGSARCRFSAPCSGFSFPHTCVDLSLRTADPKLHSTICILADAKLAELPSIDTFMKRLCDLVERELPRGEASCSRIARIMRMSTRTLARKLQAENGTTFSELLDSMRKTIALTQGAQPEISLPELAAALGFSHPSSLHRAFKRWTGLTPAAYRRQADARRVAQFQRVSAAARSEALARYPPDPTRS